MKITKGMLLAFFIAIIFMWFMLKGVKVSPVTTPLTNSNSPDLSGVSQTENPEHSEVTQGY